MGDSSPDVLFRNISYALAIEVFLLEKFIIAKIFGCYNIFQYFWNSLNRFSSFKYDDAI